MRDKQNLDKKRNMDYSAKWRMALGAFVPRHIPNRVVCGVMGLLSVLHRTSKRKREENRGVNLQICGLDTKTNLTAEAGLSASTESICFTPGKYVENQPQWKDVRFGKRSDMAYSGCEILAVYNALLSLGECLSALELVELISTFEGKGAVWAGQLGTAPGAICKYFRKRGYKTEIRYWRDESTVNELGEEYDTIIVMFYNDAHDIFKMIHTVNISKDKEGKYWVHNCYKRQGIKFFADGSYESLWNAIHNRDFRERAVLCTIGIRKNSCRGSENRI